MLKEGSNITKSWLLENVLPKASQSYKDSVFLVLVNAIIWAAFDTEASKIVPSLMKGKIRNAYNTLVRGTLGENENPVEKISIVVYDIKGVVQLIDLKNVVGECSNNNNSSVPSPRNSNSNSNSITN